MILGGNKLKTICLDTNIELESNPYIYKFVTLKNEQMIIDELKSFTIYIYGLSGQLSINDLNVNINDAIQIESMPITINIKGQCELLIAGVKEPHYQHSITLTKHSDIKKVVKPWGHELWINGQHPGYALKQIYIKSPHKTSLQYHNFKSETNMLVSGTANLHYYEGTDILNVDFNQIKTYEMNKPTVVSVTPHIIHRIEAITDLLLYEVSTPHLDDVIRIADDKNRPDGKIESEHA